MAHSKLGYMCAKQYQGCFNDESRRGPINPMMCMSKTACCCKFHPIVDAIVERVPHPPLRMFDSASMTLLDFADYAKLEHATAVPFSGKYRSADGGGNSKRYPFLGQGGRGYSLETSRATPADLPDPKLVWERLIRRTEGGFRAHPSSNMLFPMFAFLAIHDFFRTDVGRGEDGDGVERAWVNAHSSYLDLQPLYGFSEATQHGVRTMENGMLKPDAFADSRFQNQALPKVLLRLFSREHNLIAAELKKRYPDQFPTDEDLFQQARIITCGVYVTCILRIYSEALFNNTPPGGVLDVRKHVDVDKHVGYHIPGEFNLMYRWHFMFESVTPATLGGEVTSDDDMKRLLLGLLDNPMGLSGPATVPDMFGPVEQQGIEFGRQLGVGTLNAFRTMLGLEPYNGWDWVRPEAVDTLKELYGDPYNVELYTAMFVEKPDSPTSVLSQTPSFAIIADAFSSITCDRFHTTHFNPEGYTPWGFEHAKSTLFVDLVNRHLGLGLPRDAWVTKLPGAAKKGTCGGCCDSGPYDPTSFAQRQPAVAAAAAGAGAPAATTGEPKTGGAGPRAVIPL